MFNVLSFSMKYLVYLFLFSSLLITSCGDEEVVAPTTGTIKGKVLDGTTNTGIAGVSILTNPPTSAVLTNADGSFIITNVAPSAYSITATKTGYVSKSISVAVSAGSDTRADFLLFTVPANGAPVFSSVYAPLNNDTNQTATTLFSWSATDPEGDPITYNFWFGKSEQSLELKGENLTTNSFQVTSLEKGTKYYWRVVAKDNQANATESPILSFTTKNVVATVGLSAYYTFSGNALDQSGNQFHGQVNGAVLTTDRFNNPNSAYQFDGNDDYIVISNASSPQLEPSSEISISCFIYADRQSGSSPYARIVRKSAPLKGGYHLSWDHNFNNKVGAILNYEIGGNLQGSDLSVANSGLVGEWHHIVFTYSKNSTTGRLYIDGELVATSSSLVYPLSHSDSNLFIGGTTGQGVNQTFPGKIDDVRIYSRVLTNTEIEEIYHEGGFGK
jgi:hypothetical protein